MAITYTNHKGKTYHLCLLHGKEGQPHYAFTRKIKGKPAQTIPNGFAIHENEHGQVFLIKAGLVKPPSKSGDQKTVKPEPNSKVGTPTKANKKKSEKYTNYHLVNCPVCQESFRFPNLKWHIRDKHPKYKPADAIAASRLSETNRPIPNRRQSKQLSEAEKAAKARQNALKIELTVCGWCYQNIYRVWQTNGYYRYYDDRELTTRHKCTRPVQWDPDHG